MMPLSTAATFHNAPFRECRRVNRIAVLFAALHMSAHGTQRTYRDSSRMSALRGEADLA
jgi:hypothetical protein